VFKANSYLPNTKRQKQKKTRKKEKKNSEHLKRMVKQIGFEIKIWQVSSDGISGGQAED